MEDGVVKELTDIKAEGCPSDVVYWDNILFFLEREWPNHIVMEGYRLYNHKGMAAKTQANSELETPQLIGLIKWHCHRWDIPLTIQYAADVKTRWSEDVLVRLGYLTHEIKGGKNFYYFNGKSAISHHRDALKHALHYWRYKHDNR